LIDGVFIGDLEEGSQNFPQWKILRFPAKGGHNETSGK
jgi:hypothetical protein